MRVECWPAAERWEGGPAAIPHAMMASGAGWDLGLRGTVDCRWEGRELGFWDGVNRLNAGEGKETWRVPAEWFG